MIQAYVDESGGKGQGKVFVFSALVSSAEKWIQFSDKWKACLDESPSILYFKMNEATAPKGQFQNFSTKERDEKVRKLCGIIGSAGILEHYCIVKLDDFNSTIAAHSVRPMVDPYFFPFQIVILGIGYELLELGHRDQPFEIFFDENVIFGPRAKAWYPVIRASMEPILRAIAPVEPLFRSDLNVLPLQAADLTAWLHRRVNNEGLGEFAWVQNALVGLYPGVMSNRLTLERMKAIVDKSYLYTAEELATQKDAIEAYKETFNDEWPPRKRRRSSRRRKRE